MATAAGTSPIIPDVIVAEVEQRLGSIAAKLTTLKAEKVALQLLQQQLEAEKTSACGEVRSLTQQNTALTGRVDALTARNEEATALVDKVKGQLTKLEGEIKILDVAHAATVRELGETKQAKETVEAENAALKTELAELRMKISEMQDHAEKSNRALLKLRAMVSAIDTDDDPATPSSVDSKS